MPLKNDDPCVNFRTSLKPTPIWQTGGTPWSFTCHPWDVRPKRAPVGLAVAVRRADRNSSGSWAPSWFGCPGSMRMWGILQRPMWTTPSTLPCVYQKMVWVSPCAPGSSMPWPIGGSCFCIAASSWMNRPLSGLMAMWSHASASRCSKIVSDH